MGRRKIIAALLDEAAIPHGGNCLILDIGCGTGGNLQLLSSYGVCIGVDVSPFALSLCRSRWDGLILCADAINLPLRDSSASVVAALDVIEHIEDDIAALMEFWRVLKVGGVLLITVPAISWLWSGHDIALGHFRRYVKVELEAKLKLVGFKVEKISFAVCPLLPFVFLFRKLQLLAQRDAKKHTALIKLPKPLNNLLVGMLSLEARLIRRFELPFGVSLVCRAVKLC